MNFIDREGLKSSVWDGPEDWYDEKLGEVEDVFVWEASEGACEKCQALNGKEFRDYDDIPERPHPNCKCRVRSCQDYPQYDDWKVVDEKVAGYIVGNQYFAGAIGHAVLSRVTKIRENRRVHILRRCGGLKLKELGIKWKYRTRTEQEARTVRAFKFDTGTSADLGDKWYCINPWTGEPIGLNTNYRN